MNPQVFGWILVAVGAALAIGARPVARAWVDLAGFEQSRLLPPAAAKWVGIVVVVVFGLALVGIGARLLGWWG